VHHVQKGTTADVLHARVAVLNITDVLNGTDARHLPMHLPIQPLTQQTTQTHASTPKAVLKTPRNTPE
jgi:hypothetical protein